MVDVPLLLADIVRDTVAAADDVEVVGAVASADAVAAAARDRANFVIMGHDDDGLAGRLLRSPSLPVVVTLRADGARALLYELVPRRTPLGELSPDSLLDIVRRARRRGAGRG